VRQVTSLSSDNPESNGKIRTTNHLRVGHLPYARDSLQIVAKEPHFWLTLENPLVHRDQKPTALLGGFEMVPGQLNNIDDMQDVGRGFVHLRDISHRRKPR
jgi:hypothetical protein